MKYFEWRNGTPTRNLRKADVETAFAWAKSKGELDQPLLVVFVDHGDAGQLRLAPNEALSARELGGLLEDYRAGTGSQVITILEACHTGTLLPDLSGDVAITSTDERQAYYDNLGMLSFTRLFFDRLRRGGSYAQAFDDVSAILPYYGFPFVRQQPQLDDNGDGSFSNLDGLIVRIRCVSTAVSRGCCGCRRGWNRWRIRRCGKWE